MPIPAYSSIPKLTERQIKNLFSKFHYDPATGCWQWSAAIGSGGYGYLKLNDESFRAHRVVFTHFNGPIPDGLTLDHLCRNRLCVNPSHLEPVSVRTNVLRGENISAINARKTHCKNGHQFTIKNTYLRPKGRRCRQCSAEEATKYRARRHSLRK